MTDLIFSGIELMIIGMGIVFVFLTMLVVVINVMSTLVQRFFPEEESTSTIVVPAITPATDKSTIAAIAAAVHQYRKNNS